MVGSIPGDLGVLSQHILCPLENAGVTQESVLDFLLTVILSILNFPKCIMFKSRLILCLPKFVFLLFSIWVNCTSYGLRQGLDAPSQLFWERCAFYFILSDSLSPKPLPSGLGPGKHPILLDYSGSLPASWHHLCWSCLKCNSAPVLPPLKSTLILQ